MTTNPEGPSAADVQSAITALNSELASPALSKAIADIAAAADKAADKIIAIKARKPKKESNSRPARWARACAAARAALDEAKAAMDTVVAQFEELDSLRSEYEDWQGNLPENLQSGELADKLDTVVGLDFQWDAESDGIDATETMLDEAEGAELPRGFGRD